MLIISSDVPCRVSIIGPGMFGVSAAECFSADCQSGKLSRYVLQTLFALFAGVQQTWFVIHRQLRASCCSPTRAKQRLRVLRRACRAVLALSRRPAAAEANISSQKRKSSQRCCRRGKRWWRVHVTFPSASPTISSLHLNSSGGG